MCRHFSSCNSTANNPTRFCAVASVTSASLFAEAERPLFVSLMLLARDEHADQDSNTKRDPDTLIRMIANDFVSRFSPCDCLLLQSLASLFGALHSGRETGANFVS